MLPMICTRSHVNVHVGDSSWCSEEIVKTIEFHLPVSSSSSLLLLLLMSLMLLFFILFVLLFFF